jgi:hypothetical protein
LDWGGYWWMMDMHSQSIEQQNESSLNDDNIDNKKEEN